MTLELSSSGRSLIEQTLGKDVLGLLRIAPPLSNTNFEPMASGWR